jgi:type IV pilus assembly protein PilE
MKTKIVPLIVPLSTAKKRLNSGFTLVEVMIVVAIVAILSSIALPSYTDYTRRATIPEATTALADQRNKMEQFFLDNRNYGPGACGANLVAGLKSYTMTCALTGTTGYVVTATGFSTAAGFVFTINENNVQRTTGVPPTWNSAALPVNRWVTKNGG